MLHLIIYICASFQPGHISFYEDSTGSQQLRRSFAVHIPIHSLEIVMLILSSMPTEAKEYETTSAMLAKPDVHTGATSVKSTLY